MIYPIEFAKPASKQFKALPPQEKKRVQTKIDTLSNEPRPDGVTKLKGEENLYRVCVGDYRIIYTIEDNRLLVLVVKIGHRKRGV